MASFTTLDAWKVGIDLVKEIYSITKELPDSERFGLISQLQRATVSILANFAEGYSRHTNDDKAHKYTTSRGECTEVTALLLICIEIGYLSQKRIEKALDLAQQEGKILSGLIRSYRQ